MFFQPKNLKSENNKPWFKPLFNISLRTIVCTTFDSLCLEYLEYIYNFAYLFKKKLLVT